MLFVVGIRSEMPGRWKIKPGFSLLLIEILSQHSILAQQFSPLNAMVTYFKMSDVLHIYILKTLSVLL